MICLKHATIRELINLNYPLDTVVYWIDFVDTKAGMSNVYYEYLEIAESLFGESAEAMTSNTRKASVVEARNIVWTALHNINKLSSTAIGQLAKRNHASVLNGINSITDRMDVDKNLRKKYDAFCNSIGKEINTTFDEKFDYEKKCN